MPGGAHELVVGVPQVLTLPQDRTPVLAKLEAVRQNMALLTLHTPAYALKVSFQALGNVKYTGGGTMEEDWYDNSHWVWNARIGDTVVDRGVNRDMGAATVSSAPGGPMPLRVQMVRAALFWAGDYAFKGTAASLRVFHTTDQGTPVSCYLINSPAYKAPAMGRGPDEWEYCIDDPTGLLRIWSPAPTVFFTYDYVGGANFEGFRLPHSVVATEGGKVVLTIRVDSMSVLAAPPTIPQSWQRGGGLIGPATRWFEWELPANDPPKDQRVLLHLSLNAKSEVTESSVVGDAPPDLVQVVLDHVSTYFPARTTGADALNQQRDVYFGADFTASPDARPIPPIRITPAALKPGLNPYVGTQATHTVQTTADGNVFERFTSVRMARDAQGRTYREQLPSQDTNIRIERQYNIMDPVARVTYTVWPLRHFAQQRSMESPGGSGLRLPPLIDALAPVAPMARKPPVTETLGDDVIFGLAVTGTRRTTEIPAGSQGNRDAYTDVSESWMSQQLGMVLKSINTDPRAGVTTMEFTDLQIGDPPPELFQIPPDYKVVDQNGNPIVH